MTSNLLVTTLTILMCVGAILFLVAVIRFFARLILSQASAESWFTVRSWPLKPGAFARMQYRARTRAGGEIESIDVVLRCFETVQWKDLRGLRHTAGGISKGLALHPSARWPACCTRSSR